jgi:hypothetical protein
MSFQKEEEGEQGNIWIESQTISVQEPWIRT